MQTEIMELVQKHLPSLQVEALKSELAKAAKVADLEVQIGRRDEELKRKDKEISEIRSKLYETETRAKKTEELEKQERDLKVKMLEHELKVEKEASKRVEDLAMAAFRNPTVYKSYNKPMSHSNNGSTWTEERQVTETTTVE